MILEGWLERFFKECGGIHVAYVRGKRVRVPLGVNLLAWGPGFSFTVTVISVTTLISIKHPGEFTT